jgi:hypothetical protein
LIDPESRQVDTLKIFEPGAGAQSQSGSGVVSAARGPGPDGDLLFVLDQNEPALHAVDPSSGEKVASATTLGTPEVVRYIPTTNEVWVTEPDVEQIEVFRLTGGNPPALASTDRISVPGGPKGLIFDPTISFVYTNQPAKGLTTAIVVASHAVSSSWGNGCTDAEGMTLDEQNRYLFIACREGKLVTVEVKPENLGQQITSHPFGGGLKAVDYNSQTGHIYLPSGASAILGVFEIALATPTPPPTQQGSLFGFLVSATATPASHEHAEGTPAPKFVLNQVASADTALNGNCLASDPRGNIWVCGPDGESIFWAIDPVNQE